MTLPTEPKWPFGGPVARPAFRHYARAGAGRRLRLARLERLVRRGDRPGRCRGAPKDGLTYYEIWLTAFESFLAEHRLADGPAIDGPRNAWEATYLATPHGEPVKLEAGLAAG